MTSQMANFWDQTGGLWFGGKLVGKVGAAFTSTASQHGGQETTLLNIITNLLHHGMTIVGLPYSFQGQLKLDEVTGGSPYGATTIAAGDGSRQPTANELDGARFMGRTWRRWRPSWPPDARATANDVGPALASAPGHPSSFFHLDPAHLRPGWIESSGKLQVRSRKGPNICDIAVVRHCATRAVVPPCIRNRHPHALSPKPKRPPKGDWSQRAYRPGNFQLFARARPWVAVTDQPDRAGSAAFHIRVMSSG